MAAQDARIATHAIQFSPGGTIKVEVGRDCSKVVPIAELKMDKTKTHAKRTIAFSGPKKPKGTTNTLGAEAEAAMAERKQNREKARRERSIPAVVMEEGENCGTASPKGDKGQSPRRAALGSLDANSPVIAWTEQLAEVLEEPQVPPAKLRPMACSQSPRSSPVLSGKGGTLEERYGGKKKKKNRRLGIGSFWKSSRRDVRISEEQGTALAVDEAMREKNPLRQSFLLRTIEHQQEELRRNKESEARRWALLEKQYHAQMEENTRKMEEQAKKAAAAAAAELAADLLAPKGQGVENYSDPEWLDKYMATATPAQMDSYISANLSAVAPAVASLKQEHTAAAAKHAAAAAAAKEAAEVAELAAKGEAGGAAGGAVDNDVQVAEELTVAEREAAARQAAVVVDDGEKEPAVAAETPAAAATDTSAGSSAAWEELKTDAGDSYYYNSVTQETTWDRPAGFGPAALGIENSTVPSMANAVSVAVTVENVKSKLWSLLDGGDFEDMVESNTDDDTTSTQTPREDGNSAAASSVMTVDRSLLNLCIKSELQEGRSNLRSVPDVARSPNGTPVRNDTNANRQSNMALRLESDPQFENMREALARRFNEVGSMRSEMDSVRSDWSEGTSNWTPRDF